VFSFRDQLDPAPATGGRRVEVAFTDASLDVAEGAGVDVTLRRIGDELGVAIARTEQVHGADVVLATGSAPSSPVPVGDGLVTDVARMALMVRVADCVPVLLASPGQGVLGVAHAGRRGVELDVVTRTVERMRALGALEVVAWIGPHICGGCYEVPEAMRDEVAAKVPATHARTTWGTPSLDLGAGVAAQLAAAGVAASVVGACTRESPELHSFRRDGAAAGRLAGLVWMP
jgi:YfiH family protein